MNKREAIASLGDASIKPQYKEVFLRSLVLADTEESKDTLFQAFKNLRRKFISEYERKCIADDRYCLESDLNIIFLEALNETRRLLKETPCKVFSTATCISNQFQWKATAWYKDKYLSTKVIEVPFGGYDIKPYDENEENNGPWWLQEIGIGGVVAFNVSQFKEEKLAERPLTEAELRFSKELQKYYYRYYEYRSKISDRELRLLLMQLNNQKQKAIAETEQLSLANVKQIHSRAKKKIADCLAEDYYQGGNSAFHCFRQWVNEQLCFKAEKLYEELVHYFPDFIDMILMRLDGCTSTMRCSTCKKMIMANANNETLGICGYEYDGYPHFLNYRAKLLSIEPLSFWTSDNIYSAALKRFYQKDPFPEIACFGSFSLFKSNGLFEKMACLEKLENALATIKSLNRKKDATITCKIKFIKDEVSSLIRPFEARYYDFDVADNEDGGIAILENLEEL